MKFKKTEINSLEDLMTFFNKVENCPSTKKELVSLLKAMKKSGFVENLIDGAYYVRAFIASYDETLQYGIEEQQRNMCNKEINPYKEKIELVHNYIKEEENWPKPEVLKEQSISLDEFIDMLKNMPEEEQNKLLEQLPAEVAADLKKIINNTDESSESEEE